MNWEQKFAAINALCEAVLIMRKPGDWYVSQRTDVKQGLCLAGKYGNGATPEEAVHDHWDQLTMLPRDQYVIVNAGTEDRKAVRWNGYMWDHVVEAQRG